MKQSKDTLKTYFETGDYPTEAQFGHLIDSCIGTLESVSDLPEASAGNLGNEYKIGNVYYKCVLSGGAYIWKQTGTAVPSNDYTDIVNKPKINGIALGGDKTIDDLGGLDKDASKYDCSTEADPSDAVYILSGGTWKKATVAQIRRPSTASVTISAQEWKSVGSGVYRATKVVQGIVSDSVPFASPAPQSMSAYRLTPYWLAYVSDGSVTIESNDPISSDVTLNIAYW